MNQKRWIAIVLMICLVVALFPGAALAAQETVPMYRLYNPNSGEHFYTGSYEERDMLVEAGWNYEGIAWHAPMAAGDPVYRVFNPNSGDHHYTMDVAERDWLVSLGWQYEGVAWNSFSKVGVPQYRLWNPNADLGSHHYTSSLEEREFLISLGWIPEGIGWYGSAVSSHTHTWTDWEMVKEATADIPGEQKRTCKVCGTMETREVEPAGCEHSWQKIWHPEEGHYSDPYVLCTCGARFQTQAAWLAHVKQNAADAVDFHTSWCMNEDWIVDTPEHTEWVCSNCGASTETANCLHDWQKIWHPGKGHYGDYYVVCTCGARFQNSNQWASHVEDNLSEALEYHTSWSENRDFIVDSPEYTEWRCSGCGQVIEILSDC